MFSQLDLAIGFHQLRVTDDSIPLTAFKTRYGSYEWLVMPFGVKECTNFLRGYDEPVFREHLDMFVLVFIDDILI